MILKIKGLGKLTSRFSPAITSRAMGLESMRMAIFGYLDE